MGLKLLIRLSFIFFPLLTQAAVRVVQGKFKEISWGDYPHLSIVTDGKTLTFWCGDSKPLSCEQLEAHAKPYQGKNLEVHYEEVDVHVPEAGGKIRQQRVNVIKLKQPK